MDCTSLPEDQVGGGALSLRTRMLHKFLAPIDVELSVEFGGTPDQRILVFCVRCLADPMALMVVDHKGRIAHATSQLGALLGYPLATLQGMTLQQLVPPPYAQLHTGWMKVSGAAAVLDMRVAVVLAEACAASKSSSRLSLVSVACAVVAVCFEESTRDLRLSQPVQLSRQQASCIAHRPCGRLCCMFHSTDPTITHVSCVLPCRT
jgi:hypothetical protein